MPSMAKRRIENMSLNENVLLGMPTLIELYSFEENIELCKRLGLSLIELNMNLPYLQIENIKKIDVNKNIRFSIHLPEEFNIWDYNGKIKNTYLETIDELIEVSLIKNIEILNMHMNEGIYFTLPDEKRFIFEENKERYLDLSKEFGEKINKKLRNTNIKICIENTGVLDKKFIKEAVDLLIEYDSFRLTWDVGHDFSSGEKDKNCYLKNIEKIIHLHLHDAIGKNNHLPLGTGEIDIMKILESTRTDVKSIILETKTIEGLEKSINYFREQILENLR